MGWLQNYVDLLKDDLFWKSLYNTFYMVAIGVPLTSAGFLLLRGALELESAGAIHLSRDLFSAIDRSDCGQHDPVAVDPESAGRDPEHNAG